MQRLTSYGLSTAQKTIAYSNATGNILTKSDAGTYKYTITGKPYATSSVTSNGSPLPAATQQVTYTSFSRPKQITEGTYGADFVYDENAQRATMVMKNNGSVVYTRYYFANGQYEKTIQGSAVKTILYLDGSPYNATVALETNAGVSRLLYISRDHIGSITHITNASKVLQAEYSYDAWGRIRNPATLAVYAPGTEPALLLNRGYTGHEHLKEFGLINMNARLYDALVGRMISPDNYVQDPLDPMNFNRYAYAVNNPLKFTDPTGDFWHIVIGAAIGGVVNLGIKAFQGKIHNFGDGLKAFGVGAVAGAVGAATGGAALSVTGLSATSVAGGAVGGLAGSAVSSPILGGGNNLFFGDPYSFKDYGRDLLIGGVGGAVIGGTAAGFKGNNIWLGGKVAPGRSIWSFNNTPKGKFGFVTVHPSQHAGFIDDGLMNADEEFISVFHKGELKGGISPYRALSTSLDKNSASMLNRTGRLWEFRIPKAQFLEWRYSGAIDFLQDLDIVTGVINQEVRFPASLSFELIKYIVNP